MCDMFYGLCSNITTNLTTSEMESPFLENSKQILIALIVSGVIFMTGGACVYQYRKRQVPEFFRV